MNSIVLQGTGKCKSYLSNNDHKHHDLAENNHHVQIGNNDSNKNNINYNNGDSNNDNNNKNNVNYNNGDSNNNNDNNHNNINYDNDNNNNNNNNIKYTGPTIVFHSSSPPPSFSSSPSLSHSNSNLNSNSNSKLNLNSTDDDNFGERTVRTYILPFIINTIFFHFYV